MNILKKVVVKCSIALQENNLKFCFLMTQAYPSNSGLKYSWKMYSRTEIKCFLSSLFFNVMSPVKIEWFILKDISIWYIQSLSNTSQDWIWELFQTTCWVHFKFEMGKFPEGLLFIASLFVDMV